MCSMFVSTYEVNIDSKGRVSVPPSFRNELAGQSRLVLWPALDGNRCLEGGDEETFRILQQTILRSSFGNKKRRALINAFASKAHDLKLDDTGRIKLPEKWIEDSKVSGKVIFAGAMDKFQIWEPNAYIEFENEMEEIAKDEETIGQLEGPYQAVIAEALGNQNANEGR